MLNSSCEVCGYAIDLSSVEEGEIVSCPACGTEYEVKMENGEFRLESLVLEGEDWGE